ncbi:GGDEF domain-containing protein [Paenibacillus sp. BSR1-1]|uniref:GGDEF domain-containing protein n=1 Tax=Paenibacillus sp. BSR1-1 TaxID=3020845 RepID=UPI0025B1ABFC|nr:GGDEF domain-containing protein [Paenibacillus sp. BSR1-1]MDN3015409.1 GGDEF domain-containing protein [Paenibacillus sp. BSR1-1]
MTNRARIFIYILFIAAAALAFWSNRVPLQNTFFIKAVILYWFFSTLYFHLRTMSRKGNVTLDYGMNYSLSFVMFSGPLGILIFESIYRFSNYFYKKITKTADPDEFEHIFYNVGSFVFQNTISYYVFQSLQQYFQAIPFGFWILMFFLATINAVISDTFLTIIFYYLGEIKSREEVFHFFKSRSIPDLGKISFTNGMLFVFLQEGNWEILISFFILNYLVNHSFIEKAQYLQNKLERDQFEQMAYTDFLTGISNRALMDKKMAELNQGNEPIGIVVTDLDKFKIINDTYNHAVGDRVIQHFAATLNSYLNQGDFLFRSGGEEFTLFLRNRDYDQTVAFVEKIRQGVENSQVLAEFNGENVSIPYTASFGLYFYDVTENISMEKGYIYADQLLLQSKQHGRNQLSAKNELIHI